MRPRHLLALPLVALTSSGCGISDEMYQERVAEVARLRASLDAANHRAADVRARCDAALSSEQRQFGENLHQLGGLFSQARHKMDDLQRDLVRRPTVCTADEITRRARELCGAAPEAAAVEPAESIESVAPAPAVAPASPVEPAPAVEPLDSSP